MNAVGTKMKILRVAQDLFASKGFDGASIRDIAQKADVNIAAVNYHFRNKENLYWSVFTNSHEMLEKEIDRISQNYKDLNDLFWQVFQSLHDHSQVLRSAFLIMLSDSFPKIDPEDYAKLMGKKEFGPPGGKFLFDAVTDEVGTDVSKEKREWAVKTLFTDVLHWALLTSGTHCKVIYKDHPDMSMDARRKSLEMHVDAILNYLK